MPVSGNPSYYVEDMLGSSRVITTNAGVVCYDADFYPFGGERSYTNTCPQNYKFEGKERDSESGNDYAMMRYGVNRLARFSSPDLLSGSTWNPQSLNHYTYTQNDPINLSDPIGLTPKMYVCGGGLDPVQMPGCGSGPGGPQGGGGGSGGCAIDGIVTPCGIIISVIEAGATYSSIGGGGGTFQVWTPGGCVTTNDNGNPGQNGGGQVESSSSTACQNGYWSTVTLGGGGGNSSGNSSWWGAFFSDLFSWQSARQAQIDAWNKGYYSCLAHKNLPGFSAAATTHVAADVASETASHFAPQIAGTYYHFTDARFTAWGKYSEVLVPEAAGSIKLWAGRLNAAGWAYADYELAKSIGECSEVLQ